MQLLKYGLKDGKLVHINDVANGLSCGCVCPSCGGILEAHQGQIKQHHFKHYSASDCEHGTESALHIMAKNIIAQTKTVYVPSSPQDIYDRWSLGRCYKFENAYIEKNISTDIRCDILLESEDSFLNVEIKVTHEVDISKKIKLYNENIKTIEIDLGVLLRHGEDFDESIVRSIIESGALTLLVFSPDSKEIYAKWWLGEWKKIFRDRWMIPYVKKCRYANPKEITYFSSKYGYRGDCSHSECHNCYGSNEFDSLKREFLCVALYGDLDYTAIDKIVDIKRKNNIVEYAELIVNGKTKTYGNKL